MPAPLAARSLDGSIPGPGRQRGRARRSRGALCALTHDIHGLSRQTPYSLLLRASLRHVLITRLPLRAYLPDADGPVPQTPEPADMSVWIRVPE